MSENLGKKIAKQVVPFYTRHGGKFYFGFLILLVVVVGFAIFFGIKHKELVPCFENAVGKKSSSPNNSSGPNGGNDPSNEPAT